MKIETIDLSAVTNWIRLFGKFLVKIKILN